MDNLGSPVVGVTLYASATIGGNNYSSLDNDTDNLGDYTLQVASGTWTVQFLIGGGDSENLDTQGYADLTGPHNVSTPPDNAILNLTVFPIGTPVISQPQWISPTQFAFNVIGATNTVYTVQYSTSFSAPVWNTLESFQLTNSPTPVVDSHATDSSRYYRVEISPGS